MCTHLGLANVLRARGLVTDRSLGDGAFRTAGGGRTSFGAATQTGATIGGHLSAPRRPIALIAETLDRDSTGGTYEIVGGTGLD